MLGNWSESPTKIILQESLKALSKLSKRIASIMDASSIIITSQSSGFFSLRANFWESSSPHSTSSKRWIVLASLPVSSVMRFAALPVGAASSIFRFRFSKRFIIAFNVVVLPVPGPPVSTKIPLSKASKIAWRCKASNFIPKRFSTFSISSSSTVTAAFKKRFTAKSRAAICCSAL